MPSDSEDDIYGNAAKKFKILCSKSYEKKIVPCEILSDSLKIDKITDCVSTSTSINGVFGLSEDDIDKDNSFEKRTKPKKKPDYPSDLSESETEWFTSTHRTAIGRQKCRKSRRVPLKKTVSNPQKVSNVDISNSNPNNSPQKSVRTKKKGKRKTKSPQDIPSHPLLHRLLTQGPNGYQNSSDTNTRNNISQSIDTIHTLVSPVRGRSRGSRGRGCRSRGTRNRARGGPLSTSQYPTYSVGNTEDYPDNSEDIPLFSSVTSKPKMLDEIVISDEDPDDNEEVSIHVHWQNYEVFKFNIRKFQKLKQIFDFFAKKENVSEKRLFFAYNDVVLTCDDTPDSIKYTIAKFIEGGLISQDLINLVREHTSKKPGGIQIKFQCQNFKKPYEITVQPNDKLSLAMVKCAEHFEIPLDNLRFEFDGERIIGTTTAKELELENGDCIDSGFVASHVASKMNEEVDSVVSDCLEPESITPKKKAKRKKSDEIQNKLRE